MLRENATTFNPFRDQLLQIHGGCLAMTPSAAVMGTYNRFPVALHRGKGCWVWDEQNRRHLDAVAGIATCTLGHSNRAIRKALTDQLRKLQHVSNLTKFRSRNNWRRGW